MGLEVDLRELRVSVSIGIALFPQHAAGAERLLQHAEVALRLAKSSLGDYELYASDRDTRSREALALASELPGAIARNELDVLFQPKGLASTRSVVGAEALVRWRHPRRGLLTPGIFLPLVERSGVVRELTRMVMHRALPECRCWHDDGAA